MTMQITFPPRCAEKFEAQRLLASGGFACVFLAKQRGLERPVAVKLLYEHLLDDVDEVGRFKDEARITAGLHHPGIVTVIDHEVESGIPWIAYEYLSGRCLRDILRDGRLSIRQSLEIGIQVAAALEEVHGQGILHRDIKPENVVEASPGRFKITDFGIAKASSRRSRTHTGEIPGTVYYVAPELIEGTPPSAQSDLYALGIMLYELITGEVPFFGDGPAAVCKRHIEGAIPAASRQAPGVPPIVDRLLFRAMAKEPRNRFGSARQMREELERAHAALEVRSAPRRRAPRPVPTPPLISRPVKRAAPLAALAGAVTAAILLAAGLVRTPAAPGFQVLAQAPVAVAGGAALSFVRATPSPAKHAPARPAPRPLRDAPALPATLGEIDRELTTCRDITMDLVAVLAPLASPADQEKLTGRSAAHLQRLEKLHARAAAAVAGAARPDLASRARALAFVTWTQVECARRVSQVAEWSHAGSSLPVTGWEDASSPLGRAHYGDAGVPLVGAFLETALEALKLQAARGADAGPELAGLLADVQFVAQAASQAEWEPHALSLLAPHIQAFKTGLNEFSGDEARSMRWTAWCLWSWAEAGRAQANGKFYRKSALEELERLAALVPPARDRLTELASRLKTVWKVR